jgi:anti-sigma B factor antagonist
MNNDEIVPGFDMDEDKAIKIRLQKIGERCLVFYLDGRIDTYSSHSVQKRFTKAIEKGYVRIIIDARGLYFVSSTGVGVFVNLIKTLNHRNGTVVFMHFQPTVWQVLDLLGFIKWFTMAEDLDEAVHSCNGIVKDWPLLFKCPICEKRLRAMKAGRFRCGECRSILAINPEMQISLV